jgi:hypothetical protein
MSITKTDQYKWNDWIPARNSVNTFSKTMSISKCQGTKATRRNSAQCGLGGNFTVLWPLIYKLLEEHNPNKDEFLEEIPVKIVRSWAKIQAEYKPTMSLLCKPTQLCSVKLHLVSWQKLKPGISRCKLGTVTNTSRSSLSTVLCIYYMTVML